jgi:hypothetical protein
LRPGGKVPLQLPPGEDGGEDDGGCGAGLGAIGAGAGLGAIGAMGAGLGAGRGAIGAGAGLGAGVNIGAGLGADVTAGFCFGAARFFAVFALAFLALAFLAGRFAFFIPFFLRAKAARFACFFFFFSSFFDFRFFDFAIIVLPIQFIPKLRKTPTLYAAATTPPWFS